MGSHDANKEEALQVRLREVEASALEAHQDLKPLNLNLKRKEVERGARGEEEEKRTSERAEEEGKKKRRPRTQKQQVQKTTNF